MDDNVNRNIPDADWTGLRQRAQYVILRGAFVAHISMSIACAAMLTGLLIRGNPGSLGILQTANLALAMLWIGLLMNGLFLLSILAVWPIASRVACKSIRGSTAGYFVSGLFALNIRWILWNRLGMIHPMGHGPPLYEHGRAGGEQPLRDSPRVARPSPRPGYWSRWWRTSATRSVYVVCSIGNVSVSCFTPWPMSTCPEWSANLEGRSRTT